MLVMFAQLQREGDHISKLFNFHFSLSQWSIDTMHIIAHIFTSIGSVVLFQERKILPILMQIYALFGAQKWTNMGYVHNKAAPRPHQQSPPDNLLLIFTISNVHNVHNIQYLHNIQCACFKEWRRECIRVCTLSKCCHFLLCEYFSSVVLILIHQSLSIFKARAGLASLCDVC